MMVIETPESFTHGSSHTLVQISLTPEKGLRITLRSDGLLNDYGKQTTDHMEHVIPPKYVPGLIAKLQDMTQ